MRLLKESEMDEFWTSNKSPTSGRNSRLAWVRFNSVIFTLTQRCNMSTQVWCQVSNCCAQYEVTHSVIVYWKRPSWPFISGILMLLSSSSTNFRVSNFTGNMQRQNTNCQYFKQNKSFWNNREIHVRTHLQASVSDADFAASRFSSSFGHDGKHEREEKQQKQTGSHLEPVLLKHRRRNQIPGWEAEANLIFGWV